MNFNEKFYLYITLEFSEIVLNSGRYKRNVIKRESLTVHLSFYSEHLAFLLEILHANQEQRIDRC